MRIGVLLLALVTSGCVSCAPRTDLQEAANATTAHVGLQETLNAELVKTATRHEKEIDTLLRLSEQQAGMMMQLVDRIKKLEGGSTQRLNSVFQLMGDSQFTAEQNTLFWVDIEGYKKSVCKDNPKCHVNLLVLQRDGKQVVLSFDDVFNYLARHAVKEVAQ